MVSRKRVTSKKRFTKLINFWRTIRALHTFFVNEIVNSFAKCENFQSPIRGYSNTLLFTIASDFFFCVCVFARQNYVIN